MSIRRMPLGIRSRVFLNVAFIYRGLHTPHDTHHPILQADLLDVGVVDATRDLLEEDEGHDTCDHVRGDRA